MPTKSGRTSVSLINSSCVCGCEEPKLEYNFYFESRVRCPVCDRRTLWHSNRWGATEEWEEIQKKCRTSGNSVSACEPPEKKQG